MDFGWSLRIRTQAPTQNSKWTKNSRRELDGSKSSKELVQQHWLQGALIAPFCKFLDRNGLGRHEAIYGWILSIITMGISPNSKGWVGHDLNRRRLRCERRIHHFEQNSKSKRERDSATKKRYSRSKVMLTFPRTLKVPGAKGPSWLEPEPPTDWETFCDMFW